MKQTLTEVYEAAWSEVRALLAEIEKTGKLDDSLKSQISRLRTTPFDQIAELHVPNIEGEANAATLAKLKEMSVPSPEKPEPQAESVSKPGGKNSQEK